MSGADELRAARDASYRLTRITSGDHEVEIRWSRFHGVMLRVEGPPSSVYVGAQWRDLIAAIQNAAEWPSSADPGWSIDEPAAYQVAVSTVLKLHQRLSDGNCLTCGFPSPCDTVEAITAAGVVLP